jgi:hypothetical protein
MIARELPRHDGAELPRPEPDHEKRRQGEKHAGHPREPGTAGPAKAPSHAPLEPGGELEGGEVAERGAEVLLLLGLRPALFALGEVGLGLPPLRADEDPVDEGGHPLGLTAHPDLPARAWRRRARPRWIRDITVPAGTPRMPAISA